MRDHPPHHQNPLAKQTMSNDLPTTLMSKDWQPSPVILDLADKAPPEQVIRTVNLHMIRVLPNYYGISITLLSSGQFQVVVHDKYQETAKCLDFGELSGALAYMQKELTIFENSDHPGKC